jgi:phage-related protein
MRYFIFGNYNTWYDWRLTLTAKEMPPPEPKTNYIQLEGRHGSLDLSEALTGGVVYNDRTVSARFWTSEGTAAERVQVLREIITALHGKKVQIIEPDDPDHYFLGRVTVKPEAHDQVHDELTLTAICEPWRYAMEETRRRVDLGEKPVSVILENHGDKTIIPEIEVKGSVVLDFFGAIVELSDGSYKIPEIRLPHGAAYVTLTGSGSVTFIYREANL